MSPQDGMKVRDWVKAELVDCTPEKEKKKDDEVKAEDETPFGAPTDAESLSKREPPKE